MGYTDHLKKPVKWYPKKNWKKTKYFKQILPNGNTGHSGNDNQNWEIKNPSIDHTKHGKYDIDIIRKPNQKIFIQRIYKDWQKNNLTRYHRIKTWIFKIYQF